MPRRNRLIVPGLPHHITQRGNNRADVFDTDQDRSVFLDLLGHYSQQYGLVIWSYCLMTNHFHLVAQPSGKMSAAKVLGRLEADYARYFNVRRRASGHLWQARYYSVPMDLAYCWRAIAYVERNPVRAGIVEAPERYTWSSSAARLGLCSTPNWLNLGAWREHWTTPDWKLMLRDDGTEAVIGAEIREATLSGYPLGAGLVSRLEADLDQRLRQGKSGRPPKPHGPSPQPSLFE